ncbi:MAG: MATE family efflux transporter [Clostridia bacterium]|nr:MATE family efflux transporter [Clostridia bacterium]
MEQAQQKASFLGEEKISKLLWRFSVPAITGMVVQALYNVVDRIFVGQGVGDDALAALSISFPFFSILMAFAMLVGTGGSNLVSLKMGEGKYTDAKQVLAHMLVMQLIFAAVVTGLGLLFMEPLLALFGAKDAAVLEYGIQYMTIIVSCSVFQFVGFGLNHAIRASGSPKMAMVTMLIGAIINTALDPLLIFVFDWGVRGAAAATVFSQFVSMIWVLLFMTGKKSRIQLSLRRFKLQKRLCGEMIAIGMSPFLLQLAASVVQTISNNSLYTYGEAAEVGGSGAQSAYTAINSVIQMILMPIFGINQGAQPIIGYNYGARLYKRVRRSYFMAVAAGMAVAAIGFLIVMIFPQACIGVFTKNERIMGFGVEAMRAISFFLPLVAFQIISANYFTVVGKAKISIFLSLLRQVILLIPLVILLPMRFGVMGVAYASPVSDAIAILVTAALIWREMRKLKE